ncbi:GntR family transcriptional regulator [Halothiobacillus sp.]|uniref:GntR family transcriptional regulator n=1 Tax=Halothiobacillus sp. TaxID=1891311 RepID=UPI002626886D|nr:GntR family transcriptional regulator [Halothiobacillus sp.]
MKQSAEQTTLKPVATKYVYDALKEKILSFEIYPGSRVTESELADLFMVSRTPVREALLRLESEGFLTIRPKQGCFIKPINIEELGEYYGVRTALEVAAVEGACHYMPESELQQLLHLWSPDQALVEHSADQMEDKDESFHISLALGSGNSTLVKYLQDVNDHIRIIRRVDFQDEERVKRTYAEHHAIIEAIVGREVDKARNLMKRHIQRSQDFAKTLTLTQLAKKKAGGSRFERS